MLTSLLIGYLTASAVFMSALVVSRRHELGSDTLIARVLPGLSVGGALLLSFAAGAYEASQPAVARAASAQMAAEGAGAADGDEMAALARYAGSLPESPPSRIAASSMAGSQKAELPAVETMIERLAARLTKEPGDAAGWKTLGWSYANTDRHADAAKAYARALEIDPSLAEVRLAWESAKAKAEGGTGLTAEAAKAASAPAGTMTAE